MIDKIRFLYKTLGAMRKVLWFRIKRDILKREHLSLNEFIKSYKSKSKGEIIRELSSLSGKINKCGPAIDAKFKKELRGKSRKLLIVTLAQLKLEKQFGESPNG